MRFVDMKCINCGKVHEDMVIESKNTDMLKFCDCGGMLKRIYSGTEFKINIGE